MSERPADARRPFAAASRSVRASRRLLSRGLLVAALVTPLSGCQLVLGLIWMLRGDPVMTADFTTQTGLKLTEKEKKVVVLCTSPDKARANHSSLDVDLITEVSRRLKQEKIKVVDEHKVATWLDDRGGVVDDDAVGEIVKKFKVDYVILLEVEEFSTREEGSAQLFRGRARGNASVFAKRKGGKSEGLSPIKRIYNKEFSSVYPIHHPVQSDTLNEVSFRKQYFDRLSDEIGQLFHDHRPGTEF